MSADQPILQAINNGEDTEVVRSKVNNRRRSNKKQTDQGIQDQTIVVVNPEKSKKETKKSEKKAEPKKSEKKTEPKKSEKKTEPKKSDSKAEPKKSEKKTDNKVEPNKSDSKSKTQSKTDTYFPLNLSKNALRISTHSIQKCLIDLSGALSCW